MYTFCFINHINKPVSFLFYPFFGKKCVPLLLDNRYGPKKRWKNFSSKTGPGCEKTAAPPKKRSAGVQNDAGLPNRPPRFRKKTARHEKAVSPNPPEPVDCPPSQTESRSGQVEGMRKKKKKTIRFLTERLELWKPGVIVYYF